MSSARITYIGLTGYLMIHPVINRINSNPVKFRMDDRISGLIRFGAHLYIKRHGYQKWRYVRKLNSDLIGFVGLKNTLSIFILNT